jgi:ABC-type branched-subunit amino acid transport system substrate-binding protein
MSRLHQPQPQPESHLQPQQQPLQQTAPVGLLRRRTTRAVALSALVCLGLPASLVFAGTTAPKIGGTCAKLKTTSKDVSGRALVCVNRNGKKVWQAAAAATTATTATTATAAPGTTATPAKGLAKTSGFDGKTIKVGVITALSGPAAVIGKQLAAGQDVFWKYYNSEKGGIAGRYPVEVALEDNLYESNTTVQKYNKIKDNVVMISQVMGTAPTLALLPLLKADNVVASPASQDALWVREQNLFPVLEPYQVDAINAMDFVIKGTGGRSKTICAIIQNDVYGEAGLEGVNFAADKLNFNVKVVAKYKQGDQDVTGQVNDLRKGGCQLVFAASLPTEFGKILGTAATLGYAPDWIGQSPAWVDTLLLTPLKDYMTAHVQIVAVGPEWGDPTLPAAVKYAARVKQYKPDQKPDYYFTFGYFQAQATAQLLEKAVALGNLNRDGIVKAMNSLDKLTFDGLASDFRYGPPEKRDPSRFSTMFKVDPAAPFGLRAVLFNFTSEAARAYTLPKA